MYDWRTVEDLSRHLQSEANRLLTISCYDWPDSDVGDAYASLSAALSNVDHQMYLAAFLENDTEISRLTNIINDVGEKANGLNQAVDRAVGILKTARKVTQTATEIIAKVGEQVKDLRENINTALAVAEKALKYFGITLELG